MEVLNGRLTQIIRNSFLKKILKIKFLFSKYIQIFILKVIMVKANTILNSKLDFFFFFAKLDFKEDNYVALHDVINMKCQELASLDIQ